MMRQVGRRPRLAVIGRMRQAHVVGVLGRRVLLQPVGDDCAGRRADGTSAQLTNQSRPDAMVRAGVHPEAVRSANLSVARSPFRSIQLTSTPRDDTDS